MKYNEIKNQMIDIQKIMDNCRFFIVRRSIYSNQREGSHPYKIEDFERLRLIKVIKVPELEKEID